MFQEALAAAGRPPAQVIAWLDLIERGAAAVLADLDDRPRIVRIDSAGEDRAVERALIRRGRASAGAGALADDALAAIPDQTGRILAPRQHHLGFCAVLAELDAALQDRPAWRVLQPPAAIAELFDKRVTSRRYRALGVPVPEAIEDVRTPDELRAAIAARGWRSVFVKLASGSSASGIAVLSRAHAMTTVEEAGGARYNTRRIRRLDEPAEIDRLLGWLLGEGAQIERAIPKARLDGRLFDCRVLVVAGEPAFVVVRTATHPITNLHLGGQRGDAGALRAACPPDAWDAAMADCVRIAAAHRTFHLGVDLMFEPGFRGHRILEANAFGDLLPRLARDGVDVYGWQIRHAIEWWPCS
jgi:hypothetical protein